MAKTVKKSTTEPKITKVAFPEFKLDVKKLEEDAKLPTRGSISSAGYDLYSNEDVVIPPMETKLIHTGIAISLPFCYFGGIYARSGLSVKEGLRPANCVGVVDADYRGEILVALHNDDRVEHKVEKHQRVAQMIIQPYVVANLQEVEELDTTERGEGGMGSTGKM